MQMNRNGLHGDSVPVEYSVVCFPDFYRRFENGGDNVEKEPDFVVLLLGLCRFHGFRANQFV